MEALEFFQAAVENFEIGEGFGDVGEFIGDGGDTGGAVGVVAEFGGFSLAGYFEEVGEAGVFDWSQVGLVVLAGELAEGASMRRRSPLVSRRP